MPAEKLPQVGDLALGWEGLAEIVLRFRFVDRPVDSREDMFPNWWSGFVKGRRGRDAIKLFAASCLPIGKRTSETAKDDFIALWRIARACYSATLWEKENDTGILYRKELTRARRDRETLAGHASALAVWIQRTRAKSPCDFAPPARGT